MELRDGVKHLLQADPHSSVCVTPQKEGPFVSLSKNMGVPAVQVFPEPNWSVKEANPEVLAAVEPLLARHGFGKPEFRAYICAVVFLDGNRIAGDGLNAASLVQIVAECMRSSPPPAEVAVIADCSAKSRVEVAELRKQIVKSGGVLSTRPAVQSFQEAVLGNLEAIKRPAAFIASPHFTLGTGPAPDPGIYSSFRWPDQDFESFAKALAEEDDSNSVAS